LAPTGIGKPQAVRGAGEFFGAGAKRWLNSLMEEDAWESRWLLRLLSLPSHPALGVSPQAVITADKRHGFPNPPRLPK